MNSDTSGNVGYTFVDRAIGDVIETGLAYVRTTLALGRWQPIAPPVRDRHRDWQHTSPVAYFAISLGLFSLALPFTIHTFRSGSASAATFASDALQNLSVSTVAGAAIPTFIILLVLASATSRVARRKDRRALVDLLVYVAGFVLLGLAAILLQSRITGPLSKHLNSEVALILLNSPLYVLIFYIPVAAAGLVFRQLWFVEVRRKNIGSVLNVMWRGALALATPVVTVTAYVLFMWRIEVVEREVRIQPLGLVEFTRDANGRSTVGIVQFLVENRTRDTIVLRPQAAAVHFIHASEDVMRSECTRANIAPRCDAYYRDLQLLNWPDGEPFLVLAPGQVEPFIGRCTLTGRDTIDAGRPFFINLQYSIPGRATFTRLSPDIGR